jgi:hypothetical protein
MVSRGITRLKSLRRRSKELSLSSDVGLIDQRGIPTHACLNCGSNVFIIQAVFEDYDIAGWYIDGSCSSCGSPLTVPCPVDDPAR